jgi:hypothetical protein
MSDKPITRDQWSEEHMVCMVCTAVSLSGENLETHEIASGPARQAALKEPAAWLRLCDGFINGCHAAIHGKSEWPIARQLALKWCCDPDNYDRVAVNLLRGRQPEAITEAEVDQYIQQMEGEE